MTENTLRRIDARLEGLAPESLRYRVLVALRRFRSSWVDLGRLLTEVSQEGRFADWGYEDFEVYCARELGLKRPTAHKLLLSYRYMQSREPQRLASYEQSAREGPPPEVPEYQTIELLQRADEHGGLDPQDQARFHRIAFDGAENEAALRKEIRGALTAAQRTQDDDERRSRARELADIRRSSRALRRKLADSRIVPEGLRERFERLLTEIEALE